MKDWLLALCGYNRSSPSGFALVLRAIIAIINLPLCAERVTEPLKVRGVRGEKVMGSEVSTSSYS